MITVAIAALALILCFGGFVSMVRDDRDHDLASIVLPSQFDVDRS